MQHFFLKLSKTLTLLIFLIYIYNMKSEDKKIKKREDAREVILHAAKKLFTTEGYQATSIRKIASGIGLSPTTIYIYYKDKSEIAHALHQVGFVKLRTMLLTLKHVDSPFERLKALGKTYLEFALENPDYYELMFCMREPLNYLTSREDFVCWEEGKLIFDFNRKTIKECQEMGYFPNYNLESLTLQTWALVHGLCSLHITTHLHKAVQNNVTTLPKESILQSTYTAFIQFIENTKNN